MVSWISRAILRSSSICAFLARSSLRLWASRALTRRIFSSASRCCGDVPEDALQPDDRPVGAVERRFDHLHVHLVAARRLVLLDRVVRLAGLHHPPVVALVLLRQFRREEVEVGLADDLLQRAGPAILQNCWLAKVKRPCRSLRKIFCGSVSTSEW